ncbi:hypothetical protein GWK47_005131 [Chionoecetes opilio]|uniref:Uncharacterized protein n=1 Tax=Chionoecetes opilio TaxID=41210 RepID=A0A8J4YIH0_CHIOP|nr:hypothetical protein GWK47_005131 [Chionoecetes opilio]
MAQITSPGTVDVAATTPAGEAAREVKLSPLPSTDDRHVSFEEDGGVPGEEGPPKKKMNARERWYWAFDKIVAKLNHTTSVAPWVGQLSSTSSSFSSTSSTYIFSLFDSTSECTFVASRRSGEDKRGEVVVKKGRGKCWHRSDLSFVSAEFDVCGFLF